MMNEELVPTYLRGLDSLAWHSMLLFIKCKSFVVVCLYDMLVKVFSNLSYNLLHRV